MSQSSYQYFISQDANSDQVLFWSFDLDNPSLLKRIPGKSSHGQSIRIQAPAV